MPKIDSTMLKEINAAIDSSLKKNKDIKAAADVEKNIDKFISKNKEAIANAKLIQQLQKQVQGMESKIKLLEAQVTANRNKADANMKKFLDMEMNKILKQWEKGQK